MSSSFILEFDAGAQRRLGTPKEIPPGRPITALMVRFRRASRTIQLAPTFRPSINPTHIADETTALAVRALFERVVRPVGVAVEVEEVRHVEIAGCVVVEAFDVVAHLLRGALNESCVCAVGSGGCVGAVRVRWRSR